MTKDETKKLLMMIEAAYPQSKFENPAETIAAWHFLLEEYSANVVMAAFQIYVKTNNTGFAPSVSQIIGCMHKPSEVEQLSEGEAWNMVKRAIQDSAYHSEERFNELPPIIQRCVGSANMLFQWGQTDSDTVNTVIMSNFQRTYRAVLSKQDFNNKVPEQISDVVKGLADKLSGERMIEGHV